MGATLDNGIFKPAAGDRGTVFGPGLAQNAEYQNNHQHSGANGNGKQIPSENLDKGSQSIDNGDWVASGNQYYQTVTFPAGHEYDSTVIVCKVGNGTEDGDVCYPKIEKVSSSQFNVYVNDNSIDMDFLYI